MSVGVDVSYACRIQTTGGLCQTDPHNKMSSVKAFKTDFLKDAGNELHGLVEDFSLIRA